MNLIKRRAKKPIVKNGVGGAGVQYHNHERVYTIDVHGPWTQGKGHEVSFTLQLSKLEMLQALASWTEALGREEQPARKAAHSIG